MDDAEWYGSTCFNENHRPAGVDSLIHSLHRLPAADTINWIVLHRTVGEPEFWSRDRRLIQLFHDELGRLIGPALVSADARTPHCYPRDSGKRWNACWREIKTAASRLGLSRLTIHEYVMTLYRHFDVNTHRPRVADVLPQSLPARRVRHTESLRPNCATT